MCYNRSNEKKGTEDMEKWKLDRISELYRRSKTPEGLTEEEKMEQSQLRDEYRRSVAANFQAQLESTVIVRPDGERIMVKDRKKQPKE